MPGVAGKKALVKIPGAPVVFTNEATTDAGDHQNYQITNATKRIWDRATTLVVKTGGSVTGESYTFNRLTGTVTFATVNAGRAAVTVTGAYLPLAIAVGAYNYSVALVRGTTADTDFDSAFTTGANTYQPTMLDVSGSVGRRISTDATFRAAMLAGAPVVIQFYSDRSGNPDLTIWAFLDKDSVQSAVDGISDGTIDFQGAPDDQGIVAA